jgi:hypothetical protein
VRIVRIVLVSTLLLIVADAGLGVYALFFVRRPIAVPDDRGIATFDTRLEPEPDQKLAISTRTIPSRLIASGGSVRCIQTLTWHLTALHPRDARRAASALRRDGYNVVEQPAATGRGVEIMGAREVWPNAAALAPLVNGMRPISRLSGISYVGWTISLRSGC